MTKRRKRKTDRPVCPLCAKLPPDSALPLTVPFGIPTYWSSEAAFAIFEFVDEMRTILLAAYETQIQSEAQRHQQSPILERDFIPDDEVPF
jgi:hypothetical protein